MNLIMSDVEETIMIVDGLDEPSNATPAVRVCMDIIGLGQTLTPIIQVAKRRMEMLFVRGDGVILVRNIKA